MKQQQVTSGGRAVAALVAGVVVASCLSRSEPSPPGQAVQPTTRPDPERTSGSIRNGDYSCSIESGGYRYGPFRCAVYRAEDGSQVLEKLGGSQRFRGLVVADGRGFSFDGTFFCPYGDCTEGVTGQFRSVGAATYEGNLHGRSGPLGVSLQYLPGGFTYGAAPGNQGVDAPSAPMQEARPREPGVRAE